VDILIESTNGFEKDISRLSESDRKIAIQKINNCADLFSTQKDNKYHELHRLPLPTELNGYESSLYTLKISQNLKVILTVDEDPIFGQIIFTLFRVIKEDEFDKAHKDVAASLYQELVHQDREMVEVL
jgi:hypothetical protein